MKFFLTLITTSLLFLPTSISAQSVDLVWEGNGYVPPFYQGGVPWSKQALIRLWAIPQGFSNPNTLIYRWTKSGTVLGSLSGVGKNTLEIMDSVLSKTQDFRVDIMSADNIILASRNYKVTPKEPQLLVYENHPIQGFLFNRAIESEYNLSRDEATFTALPFFLGIQSLDQESLSIIWRSNASEIGQGTEITLRKPEGASGASSIGVKVSDSEMVSWPLEKGFLIQFEE